MLDCYIVLSWFELQSRYYVHFRTKTLEKSINFFVPPSMGEIVPLLLFNEDGFVIK